MNHGSLFSGIGGFDLAAEWMGWNNVFHCEWNEFGQKILKYYWPKAISYGDITKTDFTIHRGTIDVLTGGFPCQPYSLAGKRKGKEDERHLWPEMLRTIREIKPRWIVGENVFGLINWSGGLVFNEVQTDLENEGYEVQPYILPACAKNAPHRRDRIWFIAYCEGFGRRKGKRKETDDGRGQTSEHITERNEIRDRNKTISRTGVYTHTDPSRLSIASCGEQRSFSEKTGSLLWSEPGGTFAKANGWENFPFESPICNGDDGLSSRLDFETVFTGIKKPRKPNVFGKWRTESIKGGGNAIVPQVAFEIFKAIEHYNNQTTVSK